MERTLVHRGDPEPLGVAVASDRTVYWSSASSGKIPAARQEPRGSVDRFCGGRSFAESSDDERTNRLYRPVRPLFRQ